jgi:hypothetical protein
MKKKTMLLNQPVFSQQTFDSSAITVLATLYHRFENPGDYDLIIQRDGRVIHRTNVHIEKEDAPLQENIDLASGKLDTAPGYRLRAGGVMGFYASRGTGRYTVRISQILEKEKRTLLDSAEVIPAGDLFSVTLVRPGTYHILSDENKILFRIHISLPKEGKHRTDQAEVVEVSEGGQYNPSTVRLLAGQTVVFHCLSPSRIRIGPATEGPIPQPPRERLTQRITKRTKPTKD